MDVQSDKFVNLVGYKLKKVRWPFFVMQDVVLFTKSE